jgi:hypothetical protein
MQKFLLSAIFFTGFFCSLAGQNTQGIRIYLDTRKYGYANIDCNIGTVPGDTSMHPKIYAHTGLCSSHPDTCNDAIIPFESRVWQHVVGNWGDNPLDDGVGEMSRIGNGVWMLDIPSYFGYYGNPALVNTQPNNSGTVISTPMPQGATAYTMGLVFRTSDAILTGRDSTCNDIFIWKLNTGNPEVIQSQDYSAWRTGPISFQKIIDGVPQGLQERETFIYAPRIFPNPFLQSTRIEFFLEDNRQPCYVEIFDTKGIRVRTLASGILAQGSQSLYWQGNNDAGETLDSGIYFLKISCGNKTVTDKIVLKK